MTWFSGTARPDGSARAGRGPGRALRRGLWIAVGLLAGSQAGAEGLRDEVKGLLRSTGCAMSLERIAGVFTVMGHDAAEVQAVVDGLVDSGEAGLSPDRGQLVLRPEVCRTPVAVPRPVAAVPWIEDRLGAVSGCRRPLAELEAEARGQGVADGDFARAVRDLSALGRWVAEGDGLALRADLCGPGREEDRPLARVEALGTESLRAVIGILAMERGCRVSLADRAELLRDLGATAQDRLQVGRELSPDAAAALRRRLDETLGDPGVAYRIDQGSGEIVALYCQP